MSVSQYSIILMGELNLPSQPSHPTSTCQTLQLLVGARYLIVRTSEAESSVGDSGALLKSSTAGEEAEFTRCRQ